MSTNLRASRELTLLDLVDRIVERGVVLSGDITISVADVDLIYLGLRALLTSVERADQLGAPSHVVEGPDLRDD